MTQQPTVRWGLYPWSPEHEQHHGVETIHPDDLDSWNQAHPYGGLFRCIGVDGRYIILAYGTGKFRVDPALFQEVSAPPKQIGDPVEVESKGQVVRGVVVDIQWHHQRKEPIYFIEKEGKRSSRRYWSSDFL